MLFDAILLANRQTMALQVIPTKAAFVLANRKAKLLDQVREVLRIKHYSLRTETAYVLWVRRFLKFHRDQAGTWRHPRDLGTSDVGLPHSSGYCGTCRRSHAKSSVESWFFLTFNPLLGVFTQARDWLGRFSVMTLNILLCHC